MLKTFCAVLALLPYVSPGIRFPAEVQPWAGVYAWALVGLYWLMGRRGLVDGDDWLLVIISVALLLYIQPANLGDPLQYLRKSLAFLFSLSIYFVAKRLRVKQLMVATSFALLAYLAFSFLQYVANPTYTVLIAHLVPVAPQFGGGRGASSLSPEATDFGFTAVYLFVLFLICGAKASPLRRVATLGLIGAAVCVALSKSGSGTIALAIVLGLISWDHLRRSSIVGKLSLGLLLAIGGIVAIGAYRVLEDIRGVQLLVLMLSSPTELLDTSFVYRFVHNWVGVLGLIQSGGLGFGAGSFTVIAPTLYEGFGLGTQFGLSSYYLSAVLDTLATFPAGVIPMLLLEYGALGVLYAVLVFSKPARSSIPYRPVVLALLVLSWLQSFPVAYPPFWLLLGLSRNPHFSSPGDTARGPVGASPRHPAENSGPDGHHSIVM